MSTLDEFAKVIIFLLLAIFILHVIQGGWSGGWTWIKGKFTIASASK